MSFSSVYNLLTSTLAFLILSLPVNLYALSGKVISVEDGDTITILSGRTQTKIRLYGIDCPEDGQPFGRAAKKFTSRLVHGKHVSVTKYDTDKYGRTVGVVLVNGVNVNHEIIGAGYAWQYRKYCKEKFCDDWKRTEYVAKVSKDGLWDDPHPEPPWEWRKKPKKQYVAAPAVTGATTKRVSRNITYHGNRRSHVFHSPSCRHYNCKNCVRSFSSRERAINSGFRPCGLCRP